MRLPGGRNRPKLPITDADKKSIIYFLTASDETTVEMACKRFNLTQTTISKILREYNENKQEGTEQVSESNQARAIRANWGGTVHRSTGR